MVWPSHYVTPIITEFVLDASLPVVDIIHPQTNITFLNSYEDRGNSAYQVMFCAVYVTCSVHIHVKQG